MTISLKAEPVGVLITGGTLDKIHDTVSEGLVLDGTTRVSDIFDQGRTRVSRFENLMQIDSLDMTNEDRKLILNAVYQAPEDRMIITHGTGTMGETARYLDAALKKSPNEKTIILTGAMRPWSLGRSDGTFNLGGAIIAARLLPAGVYGIMNGQVFDALKLHKNTASGRFD